MTLIQFLIQRHDDKKEKESGVMQAIAALADQIKVIDAKLEEQSAITARVRILRFADEMREDRRHSKDAWDQVLQDCDIYDEHCVSHPKFKNNITSATVSFIKDEYRIRLEKHDFL